MTTPTSTITAEWLSALLPQLGQDADQVASTLRREGITGVVRSPGDCPIARYVLAQARRRAPSEEIAISVASEACLTIGEQDPGYQWVRAEVPEPVGKFIQSFDQGAYDDLVAKD